MEIEKLNEFKKKIGEYLSNIESGTFDHCKLIFTPHTLKEGQKTQGQNLVELSRKRLYSLIDEFYAEHE